MNRKQRYTSDSDEEDSIGALTGRLSKLTLPNSAPRPLDRPAREQTDNVHSPRGHDDPERSERLSADAKAAYTEDGLFFDPADYPDQEECLDLLQKFFETSAPSKVKRSDGIGWISVRSPSFVDEGLGDTEGLVAAWKELTDSTDSIEFSDVKELAITYRCLSGIWLLCFDTGVQVDEAWEKIATATAMDELGTHAKVSPLEDKGEGKALHGNQHAVSVYTKDFTNKKDVMEIEHKLRDLGMKGRMTYKPRFYTIVGVYSQNKWRLRPGIYTSHWNAERNASSIRNTATSNDANKGLRK